MQESITLTVSGMKCGGCEANVNKALAALAGVQSVQASAKEKSVAVQFDAGAVGVAAIKAAIVQAGYTVEEHV